ncbi:unnamed protein product [[Candida] boidinii]|uniref:Unnamed protein product n=1 Tax=Candida boidinii TaxID=5477 RepID=A0A9W6SWJ7_CANBO|nr:hypothetical protein B5S30_g740 [[Candida] boidinii]GME68516.1 unnamed protein product [[Candida] boidinii]GMF99065.1 unnamed protein product [[Candida] boidinii]
MDLYNQIPDSSLLFNEDFEALIEIISSNNITVAELLLSDSINIAKKTGRSIVEIKKFINLLRIDIEQSIGFGSVQENNTILKDKGDNESGNIINIESEIKSFSKVTVKDLIERDSIKSTFSTGDDKLDGILKNGIPLNSLIEISGGSSTGKSHFLMTLAATIQLPLEFGGLGLSLFGDKIDAQSPPETENSIKVVYITTESRLETKRLTQIIDAFKDLLQENGIEDPKFFPSLNNVLTPSLVISDLEYQDHMLFIQLPQMLKCSNGKIKLVVIDSITHHIRAELTNYYEREAYINKIGNFLQYLIKTYNITIIVANQVTDKPLSEIIGAGKDYYMSTDYQLSFDYGWDNIGTLYRQMYNDSDYYEEWLWNNSNDYYNKPINKMDLPLNSNKQQRSSEEPNMSIDGEYPNMANDTTDMTCETADTTDISSSQLNTEVNSENPNPREKRRSHNSSETEKQAEVPGNESGVELNDLLSQIKTEKKLFLFESTLKDSINHIKTIPALGLTWLNFVDLRIVLERSYKPIFDEELINDFAVELGIDTSTILPSTNEYSQESDSGNDNNEHGDRIELSQNIESTLASTSTQKTLDDEKKMKILSLLSKNDFLSNKNFSTQRKFKYVFGPNIVYSDTNKKINECNFEIWAGGIRSCL